MSADSTLDAYNSVWFKTSTFSSGPNCN